MVAARGLKPKIENGDPMGPNGDPKTEKGPHGDPGPQMGTHVGAVPTYLCSSLREHPERP